MFHFETFRIFLNLSSVKKAKQHLVTKLLLPKFFFSLVLVFWYDVRPQPVLVKLQRYAIYCDCR